MNNNSRAVVDELAHKEQHPERKIQSGISTFRRISCSLNNGATYQIYDLSEIPPYFSQLPVKSLVRS